MTRLILLLALLLPGSLAAQYRESHGYKLASSTLTPGATLTKDTAVICHRSTKTVRNVPKAEKVAVVKAYGLRYCPRTTKGQGSWLCPIAGGEAGLKGAAFELDHKVALEDGGSNDPANLYPQPWDEARVKDLIENWIHSSACAGTLKLEDGQRALEGDWTIYLSKVKVTKRPKRTTTPKVPPDSVSPLLQHS